MRLRTPIEGHVVRIGVELDDDLGVAHTGRDVAGDAECAARIEIPGPEKSAVACTVVQADSALSR